MAQYLSPGVYVEEIPSAVQAIVGVSTSTAGFIGKASKAKVVIPPGPVSRVEKEDVGTGDDNLTEFKLGCVSGGHAYRVRFKFGRRAEGEPLPR